MTSLQRCLYIVSIKFYTALKKLHIFKAFSKLQTASGQSEKEQGVTVSCSTKQSLVDAYDNFFLTILVLYFNFFVYNNFQNCLVKYFKKTGISAQKIIKIFFQFLFFSADTFRAQSATTETLQLFLLYSLEHNMKCQ